MEEGRQAVRVEKAEGSGGEALVRRRARCSGGAYLLAGYASGEDGSFGPWREVDRGG